MNFIHATTIAGLACVGLLTSDVVDAQARGPSRHAPRQTPESAPAPAEETVAREAKLTELQEWLGGLVGHYRLEGTVSAFVGTTDRETSIGKANCRGGDCFVEGQHRGVGECGFVGSGPGVLCKIEVPWPQFTWDQVLPLGSARASGEIPLRGPNLGGARILYGVDPDNLGIRFLMADGKSLAVEALGFLQEGWAVFTTRCVNHGTDNCKWEFRIRVRSGEKPTEMHFKSSDGTSRRAMYVFTMRREAQVAADGAPAAPGAEQQ